MTVQWAHGVAFLRGAAVLLALAACHHPVHHPGEEWLGAIHFAGNHAISDSDLRRGLALRRAEHVGDAADPYVVSVDSERVRGMYVRRGYLEAEVRSSVERKGDEATVTYKIVEGPRATTRTEITGLPEDPDLPIAKVRHRLALEDGKPFDYAAYDHSKEPLLGIVQDAGYAHAALGTQVFADRETHQAIVQLEYDPGPKCKFGAISITGTSGELADAVRARLAFSEGDQFSQAAILTSQRAIYDMKRFATVRIQPNKAEGEAIDIKISLSEGSQHEVSFGGGFGADPASYEVRGRAGYSIASWPFPLDDVMIDLRPAYAMLRDGSGYEPRIRALAQLQRIDLFHPFITGSVAVGYDYIAVESYTYYGPVARLGLQSPLGIKQLQLRIGWRFEDYAFSHLSPLIDPTTEHSLGLDQSERVGEFQQAIALDLRDNPVEPHLGLYSEVRVNEGTPYAGGAQTFEQVTPEVRGYVPVPLSSIVLAARVRVGRFYGDVPVTERYFSGGATTQRGFSERRLAPTLSGDVNGAFTSIPLGGGGLFESNIELRSELGKVKGMGLGGVVFLDGGDVTDQFSELNVSNLHWATGLGFRLFTILGALSVDFGYRLNRTGPDEPEPGSHWAFHFNIGEAY